MLTFPAGAGWFAVAGLVAASGPIIIHLLNRRRFRVVKWAAMDFLFEAVQRNRRILHLRDLLLLLLRTAAVLLFGLALARPMFSHSDNAANDNEPVHAVVVLDNSLSMGYEKLDRTVLDEAKTRAREFFETLPDGSRISVLPLCGSAAGVSTDAYRTNEDARDALDRIEVVDRGGSALQAIEAGNEARARVPEMKDATRLVFIGDQQAVNWPHGGLGDAKSAPEMQVVSLAPSEPVNSWIESFEIQDGIADVETPAVLLAKVRHQGPARSHVQVTLSVDGTEVDSETVDLEDGQTRQVVFRHRFDAVGEAGKPVFMPAKVSLPPDRLPGDDQRFIAVPVVAALPVVFVDQYGADEDPKHNRFGETRHIRRLLAPVSRGDANRQLVQVRHVKIDQVDRSLLEDARLVVIAGVSGPGDTVPLLREYVRQGGQLMIVAGAEFDPAAWNQAAWLDGGGILPAPLKPQLFGKTPEESAGELAPFLLSLDSMSHDVFQLADVPRDELEDLYSLPLFFKAAEVDGRPEISAALTASETARIIAERETLAKASEQARQWAEADAKGTLTEEQRQQRTDQQHELSALRPTWLLWPDEQVDAEAELEPSELAERSRPQVLAAFDNKLPFLVERKIDRGQVMFVSSGLYSPWNTLAKTNAMLMMDRVLRGMLQNTLPPRNLESVTQFVLPVSDRNALYNVQRPDGLQEPLAVDALGPDAYGVTVRNIFERGCYKVTATKADVSADPERQPAKLWETVVAVNGPATESDLTTLDDAALQQRMAGSLNYRWVGPGETISLGGAQVSGQNLWKWLLGLVLVALLVELAILARPWAAKEPAV